MIRTQVGLVPLLLLAAIVSGLFAAENLGGGVPGAKVIEIQGPVEAKSSGAEVRTLKAGGFVNVGDELTIWQNSTITLAMTDKTLRRFTGPTTLKIEQIPEKTSGTVLAKLTTTVADMLFGTEGKSSEAVMATRHVESASDTKMTVPVLTHPSPGERLLEIPREFRWISIQGVPLYRVSVYNSKELMWQSTLSEPRATCPKKDCDFRPGETYYWVVEALMGNTTLRSEAADFTILESEGRADLYKALSEADTSMPDSRMSMLLRVRLCVDAGVFTKALEILDDHIEQSPGPAAYLLRAQTRETMGLAANAIADYRRAMALPASD